MNFNSKTVHLAWSPLSQLFLAMKLTAVILFAALTNVSAKSYSQIVTLHEKKTSIEKVLRLIEKQTGYHFLYDKQVILKAGAIHIDVANEPVEEVLEKCLKDQPLTYKIFEQTIVIKLKEDSKTTASVAAIESRVQ